MQKYINWFKLNAVKINFYGDLITCIGSALGAAYFIYSGKTTIAGWCVLSSVFAGWSTYYKPQDRLRTYMLKRQARMLMERQQASQ